MSQPEGQYNQLNKPTVSLLHYFSISPFHYSKQQTYTQYKIHMLIWLK